MTNPVFNTELNAVNTILSSIGELPTTQIILDAGSSSDVVLAKQVLDEVVKATQTDDWYFNEVFGIGLQTDDATSLLNWVTASTYIHAREDVISVACRGRLLTLRSSSTSRIVYDLERSTETFPEADKPASSQLSLRYYLEFFGIPEAVKRYITVKASRIFQDRTVGSQEHHAFSKEDEVEALKIARDADLLARTTAADDTTTTSTSLTEGVSTVLMAMGESPTTLREINYNASKEIVIAKKILQEVNREVLSRGWVLNTTQKTLHPNTSGVILVEDDILRVAVKGRNLAVRDDSDSELGPFLIDLDTGLNSSFGGALSATVVQHLPFDKTSEPMRNYVKIRAARIASERTGTLSSRDDDGTQIAPNSAVSPEIPKDEAQALSDLMLHDIEARRVAVASYSNEGASTVEAVNTLLRAVNRPPITKVILDAGVDAAAREAEDTLMSTSREVQARGWHFNTDSKVSFPLSTGVAAQGMVHVAGIPDDADEFTVATTSGVPWRFRLTTDTELPTGTTHGDNESFISLLDSSDEILTTEYLVAQAITAGINHSVAAAAGVTARQVIQGQAGTTPPYSYNVWEVGIISLDEYPTNHPDYVVDSSEITPYDQSALHGKNILLTQDTVGASGNGLVVNAESLNTPPNDQLNTFNFGENGMRVGKDAGNIVLSDKTIVSVNVSGSDYTIRHNPESGERSLYDKENNTFVFSSSINEEATVVYLFKFDEVPEAAKRYITIRATRVFQDYMLDSVPKHRYSKEDEMRALLELKDSEEISDPQSIFGSATTFNIIKRGSVL